jgi:hypothetical protein
MKGNRDRDGLPLRIESAVVALLGASSRSLDLDNREKPARQELPVDLIRLTKERDESYARDLLSNVVPRT